VTTPFALGCGSCVYCFAGDQQVCEKQFQPGFTGPGSFAEYVALPFADVNLVRLPDEIEFVNAAALGCRVVTANRPRRRRRGARKPRFFPRQGDHSDRSFRRLTASVNVDWMQTTPWPKR
jgi:D-arabinose 1-dehydrogenase-like Zn-dependent alcohol dehydrogenase